MMVKVVTEKDLPKYVEAYKWTIKRAWETKEVQTYWDYIITPKIRGVSVRMRGSPWVWEFWPKRGIEKIV